MSVPRRSYHKKSSAIAELFLFLLLRIIRPGGSTGGASVGASAAINAFIGIDFVDIAFRDSVGGTFAHASARKQYNHR